MKRGRSAALSLALVAASLGGREASAQNTYADVPCNQGSLFYRPSGAKPPEKPAATITTLPRLLRWVSRPAVATPAAPARYAAPVAAPVAAPTIATPTIATTPTQPGYYPAPPPPLAPR